MLLFPVTLGPLMEQYGGDAVGICYLLCFIAIIVTTHWVHEVEPSCGLEPAAWLYPQHVQRRRANPPITGQRRLTLFGFTGPERRCGLKSV